MTDRSQKIMAAAGILLFVGIVWHYVWMSGDGWWYLALGREIFGCRCLPEFNDLTFTGHWTRVVHQQWLPYVLYFGSYKAGGYGAVYGIATLLLAGALALSVAASSQRGAPFAASLVIALFGAMAFRGEFSVRSEPLVDLLFAAEVLLYNRLLAGRRAHMWALIPLFILWANSHSSLPLAAVYPLVLGIGLWADGRGSEAKSGYGRAVLWLVAACVATLINPYGPAIYGDIAARLSSPSVDVIEIFRSPDFADRANLLQGLWMLMLWIGLIASNRRARAADIAVCGAFSLLFLFGQRYFIFLLIASLPAAAQHWSAITEGWFMRPAWKYLFAGICAIAAVYLLAVPRHYAGVEGSVDKAASFMEKAGVRGHVFNYYTWGGFLLWKHPDLNIFIDGRNNIYEESGVFDDYRAAARGESRWKEIFDIYDIEAVIWPVWESSLTTALSNDPDWKPAFIEGEAAVFLKRSHPD